jgi:KDO2-lipid IV(A) lauroyltransferase
VDFRRLVQRAGRRAKFAGAAVAGRLTVGVIRTVRLFDRKKTANLVAAIMRAVGPRLKEHRVGRQQLERAFPEKSPAEVEKILAGVWDNLGRLAVEFAHIDRLHILDPARPGPEDIVYDQRTFDIFHRLRLDGKPGLIFTAHLANWELAAYVAAAYKLHLHVLYRRPNLRAVDAEVRARRAGTMGTLVATGIDAPVKLLRSLEAGGHAAMLVDQYIIQGVDVTFFGRRTKANPLIAQLARHVECPIHGARMIRLPELNRFRIEMTEAIVPARDAEGRIDVEGTTQIITNVVEAWVREHPEQWLWLHRRWRGR